MDKFESQEVGFQLAAEAGVPVRGIVDGVRYIFFPSGHRKEVRAGGMKRSPTAPLDADTKVVRCPACRFTVFRDGCCSYCGEKF